MEGIKQFSRLASIVLLILVVGAGEAGAKDDMLCAKMRVQMDADKDGRVSEKEYVDFGTAYLNEKERPCDPAIMQAKFAGFDRDGDGFITDNDRTCMSPQEKLEKIIFGTWSCENSSNEPMSFIFFADGQADIIHSGVSLREKFNGAVTYRFVPSDKAWACVDIIINQKQGHEYYFKCIIAPLSENKLKLRMANGDASVPRPAYFSCKAEADTIVLKRKVPPTPSHAEGRVTLFGIPVGGRREPFQ